ncbi:MAG: aryl-sulfate sulfotransferase [Lewinellaceae bacterium]|nr:aryl-sulfate sulfotransferase [Phaeodactylibacter sp.]MCB9035534.1 aryl-sulfate sulfotransferase [Lewinellaceae bacterium]
MAKSLLLITLLLGGSPLAAQQTVGLFLNDSLSFNGYTLLAPNSSTSTYLLDNCGEVVHSWPGNYRPGNVAYLLENGRLLRTGRLNSTFNSGGSGGRIELIDWEGNVEWGYNYSSATYHQHHDVEYLPNGNILLIAWELHSRAEAIGAGRDPNRAGNNGLWAERVVELEPVGAGQANVVWQWSLWDHLIQDFDASKANYGVVADHPELVDLNFETGNGNNADWIHLNAVDYNPALDQIVVSSRSLSEFWVIDHSTTTEEAKEHTGGQSGKGGDLLYRWGNPRSYRLGTTGDQKLFNQHNVHWIEEGLADAGRFMVFNNGVARPDGNYSTIDIVEPPVDENGLYVLEDGQAYGPGSLSWTYRAEPANSFFSANISGAQRLPNDNTLICEGRDGHLFEVDYEGRLVWEYVNPVRAAGPVSQGANIVGNDVFRAYRFPPDFPAFEGKNLDPQGPLELNPLPSDCVIYGNPVSSAYMPEALARLRVLSNPVGDEVVLENETGERLWMQVFSLTGQLMAQEWVAPGLQRLNARAWAKGLYMLRVERPGTGGYFVQKIVK